MDYVSADKAHIAIELKKYQWDYIHNPQKIIFAWAEEEEEGAMMLVEENYKFKIVETNNKISSNKELKTLCRNEKITLQLYRNDTIDKGTWKLDSISISDTTNFTLDKK